MDLQTLSSLYRTKTDEELIHLAEQRSDLTSEARSALAAELAVRRIELAVADTRADKNRTESDSSSRIETALNLHLQTGKFIEEVLQFYSRNRWTFIKIIFPAVVTGYVSVLLAHYGARNLEGHLLRSFGGRLNGMDLLEVSLISTAGYFVSWMVSCFAFAAVSSAVDQAYAGFEVSIRESFGAVCERVWPLLRASILLLALFFALEVVLAVFALDTVLHLVESHWGHAGGTLIFGLSFLFWGSAVLILSRFSLAIPALILDDYGAGHAMFQSDELTKGRWMILVVLLSKSIIGGYVAGMLPFWLARLIPASVSLPSWFQWVLAAASVGAVTLVEPIMFIGFALLYLKTTAARSGVETQAATA
jgi:hypothetical protein